MPVISAREHLLSFLIASTRSGEERKKRSFEKFLSKEKKNQEKEELIKPSKDSQGKAAK
jgi:hypothetical protein